MSSLLGKKTELNLAIIEKTVNCVQCGYGLSCYGYMINGNINCCNCNDGFILTQDLWDKSYTTVAVHCSSCKSETKHGIIQVYEFGLEFLCLTCKNIKQMTFDQIRNS